MSASILEQILPEHALGRYSDRINLEAIARLRSAGVARLERGFWNSINSKIGQFNEQHLTGQLTCQAGCVIINSSSSLTNTALGLQEEIIRDLLPWRIGPYKLNGLLIDSEWQSQFKFDRVYNALLNAGVSLQNKLILDLGANNGYFSLRLLADNPALIVAIDPQERALLQMLWLKSLVSANQFIPALASDQDLHAFPDFFDIGLCLGVLYHRRNPLLFLRHLHATMRASGVVILDTLVLPGADNQVFSVPERYCGMHNIYLVPTVSALKIWLQRNGFADIELVDLSPLSKVEQRKTNLAPFHSLDDFLDPQDNSLTVEGFAAPLRAMLLARAKK